MRSADPVLRQRLRAQFDRGHRFDRAEFLAALSGFRLDTRSGTTDIHFSVGPGEKDAAWPVSDSQGELLIVTVERISAKETPNGRARTRKTRAKKQG